MIGSVANTRAAPGNRMLPRTSTNAAMVPMTLASTATTSATSTELRTASSSSRLDSASSYQSRVRPVIGRPGVRGSLKENNTSSTIGAYRNARITSAQSHRIRRVLCA